MFYLYKSGFDMPFKQMVIDFNNPVLAPYVVSLLLRQKTIPCISDIVWPLMNFSRKSFLANGLLIKMLEHRETSKLLIMNTKWMVCDLPSFEDTVRVFMLVSFNFDFWTPFDSISILKKFLLEDNYHLISVLPIVLSRISINSEFEEKLSESGFYTGLFSHLKEEYDITFVKSMVDSLVIILKQCYIKELVNHISLIIQLLDNHENSKPVFRLISIMVEYPDYVVYLKSISIPFPDDSFGNFQLNTIQKIKNAIRI